MKKFYMIPLNKITILSLFCFSFCTLLFAQTNVSGNQSGIWNAAGSPYILTATVTIQPGTTLTINPGVTVQFTTGAIQLQVQGTLKAIGTTGDSIHFIRNGSLHGNDQLIPISFEASSQNSDMEFVNTDGLGFFYFSDQTYGILIKSGSCKISHCTIQNISGTAIGIAESVRPIISDNIIRGNRGVDIVCHPDELKNIMGNDSLNIGLMNGLISTAINIASTDTLKADNGFYRLLSSITIPFGRKFIINPETQVQFNGGAVQLNVQGTLNAIGRSGQNIKFFRNGDLHGNDQIVPIFFGAVSQNSFLEYVTIDGLGYYYNSDYTTIILVNSSNCTIDNCFIQNIKGTSIIIGKGAKPDINNNYISSSNMDVVLDPDKLRNLSNNNALKIGLTDSIPMAFSDTLTSNNIFYRLLNTVTIPQTRTLVIDPNVVLQFPTGTLQLIVQGTLKALGIIDNNIQFNRLGDLHGNDQLVPIIFDVTSQNSVLRYVTIDGLGYYYNNGTTPIMIIKTSSCQVINTIIQNSKGVAVEIQNSASPTFLQSCFYYNISGAALSISGKSKFRNCNFLGNNSGIVNKSTTDVVDAANCWWGDASGPFQRTTNPTGVGDSVSAGVIYRPFSTDQFDCNADAGPLPLTLLDFKASLLVNQVNCSWQTAQEINTRYFIVERSIDASNFNGIGKVNAAGNSNLLKNYQFEDRSPNNGNNYYRLKMVDKDTRYTYSKVLRINIKSNTTFTISPNPVSNNLFMQVQREKAEQVVLEITDMQGKILRHEKQQLPIGISSFSFNTSALSKGTYIFLIKGQKPEAKLFVKE